MAEDGERNNGRMLEPAICRDAQTHFNMYSAYQDKEGDDALEVRSTNQAYIEIADLTIHKVHLPSPPAEDIKEARIADITEDADISLTCELEVGMRDVECYVYVRLRNDVAEIEEFDVESVEIAPESNIPDRKSGQEVASISEGEEYLIKSAIRFAIEDRDSPRIIQDPYEDK